MSDGEPFGALTLYAEESNAFNERAVELFTELADNLAYGVTALRTREERSRAEHALREGDDGVVERIAELLESSARIP